MVFYKEKKVQTRRAVVRIAEQIMQGIEKSFLMREGKPVVILVEGAGHGGKTIFPDVGTDYIEDLVKAESSDGNAEEKKFGKNGYDEYRHFISAEGLVMQASFMNAGWGSGYSDNIPKINASDLLKLPKDKKVNPFAAKFLEATQNTSGVVFIHNTHGLEPEHDIKITVDVMENGSKAGESNWKRVITITGNSNSGVATSEKFQQQLALI